MNQTINVNEYINSLNNHEDSSLKQQWEEAYASFQHKIVVLDDDPTGVQTVHDVAVYTDWEEDTIHKAFQEDNQMFFILTNSRSFSEQQTADVHQTIAERVESISNQTNIPYILISRGDSTLRGHYPLETDTLRNAIEDRSHSSVDGEILIPFFKEGGRFTIEGVHYVKSGNDYIPAGETEFAKDRTFGFQSSDLRSYVEEKTKGAYAGEDVTTITLESLRAMDIDTIHSQLQKVSGFGKVVVDALTEEDLQVFSIALIRSIQAGKQFLFRTAASFTKVIGNISSQPLLTKEKLVHKHSNHGGLIIVGSHVNKTTEQLNELKKLEELHVIEFDSHLVLDKKALEKEVERVIKEVDETIQSGLSTVVYTRRERLDLGEGKEEEELKLSVDISKAVTNIVRSLTSQPKYMIAKGGITSSDIGTHGLGVTRANVMGQVAPGIPVWKTDEESKFPNLPYIIFPGNVGDRSTLKNIVQSIS
ncbi:four-carbon acid sugar kinase family protein [Halobacillus kuroshimensis]|uniref:four-carbon acid sugar kinase family protein n=1 Tax=Halobacillus kuroshimensis TaxID=302481 RepID=UPI0004060D3A|nr:four-carbon acid sugar kinase family protein [Halobacillus kuroshimensis]